MQQQLYRAALISYEAGDMAGASRNVVQILQDQPNNPDALHLMGAIGLQVGNPVSAVECITRAIQLAPKIADYWNTLGNALKALGRLDEAVQQYQIALQCDKECFDAMINLGTALNRLGRAEEASEYFRRALRIDKRNPAAYNNYGNTLQTLNRLDDAINQYEKAIRLNPDFADAHFNLGNALLRKSKGDEAIAAYREAIRVSPAYFPPYFQLGTIYKSLQQFDEAVQNYEEAARVQPGNPLPFRELGHIFAEQGLMEQARDAYGKALALQPQNALLKLRLGSISPVVVQNHDEIFAYQNNLKALLENFRQQGLEFSMEELAQAEVYVPFFMAYQGSDDGALRRQYAELFAAKLTPASPGFAINTGKPRIGFVVTDSHEGIFCRFMGGVLRHFSAEQLDITVIGTQPCNKKIAASLQADTVQYHQVSGDLLPKIEAIRQANYDLLFYFEVGTDSMNYLLPFFRLAPVQCTTWGVAVTSGIPAMDYYLSSDLIESENAQEHYSEELIRLKTLPTFYEKPTVPEVTKTRADFNLPEGKHLYGCLQRLFKFHPDFDAVLADILRQDPDGLIVLIEDKHDTWKTMLLERFARTMPDVCDRIRILPRQPEADFKQLLALCDVCLDPLHFGGGNTTYEALAFGIPIITQPGSLMRGRITAGCYQKMGLQNEGCITQSPAQYAELAVRLGTDAALRESLKQKILTANTVLYEDMDAVREIERFLIDAVEKSRSRLLAPINQPEEMLHA